MNPVESISQVFEALSAPARLQILLALGSGEACVCHLEATLNLRQAYISQQLMLLKEKGLITSRRAGKYIYYSLTQPELLDLIQQAARLAGFPLETLATSSQARCECPRCEPVPVSNEPVQIQGEPKE